MWFLKEASAEEENYEPNKSSSNEEKPVQETVVEENSNEECEDEEEECDEEEEEEQEKEEELKDPQQVLRDECNKTDKCKAFHEKYQECHDRVNSKECTAETCAPELFDWLHSVNECVTKTLFNKLK